MVENGVMSSKDVEIYYKKIKDLRNFILTQRDFISTNYINTTPTNDDFMKSFNDAMTCFLSNENAFLDIATTNEGIIRKIKSDLETLENSSSPDEPII